MCHSKHVPLRTEGKRLCCYGVRCGVCYKRFVCPAQRVCLTGAWMWPSELLCFLGLLCILGMQSAPVHVGQNSSLAEPYRGSRPACLRPPHMSLLTEPCQWPPHPSCARRKWRLYCPLHPLSGVPGTFSPQVQASVEGLYRVITMCLSVLQVQEHSNYPESPAGREGI